MVATGVPHSILILARMDRCDAKQDLPSQVAREILKTVHVEGAVPPTEEGVLKMMGSMEKSFTKMLEKCLKSFHVISPQLTLQL